MCTLVHAHLHTNSFVYTENVFWSALLNAGKRSDLSATASSVMPALSLFNTEQRRPPTATFSNNHAVSPASIYPTFPYRDTFRKHSSILLVTFTSLDLLPRSFYFQAILRDRLNLHLANPQVYDFPFSILSIIRC